MNRFDKIVTDIYQNFPSSRKSDLSLLKGLLEKLGDPQRRMPPAIHIVGTNGKGSTQAFLRSCLSAAGYKVHAYTSPHLVHFTERIYIAGNTISHEQFLYYYDQIVAYPEAQQMTWFELITTIAFMAFADHPADIAIIEAGIGGRLDATNMLHTVLCTIMTSISHDHQQQLGTTLTSIATEKAAVIRQDTPVVTCLQQAEVLNVIQQQALLYNSPLYKQHVSWDCHAQDDHLYFRHANKQAHYTLPDLPGAHQIQNAGLALTALTVIHDRFPCTPQAINTGLSHSHWPGRLQKINPPAHIIFTFPHDIYLDCAHNEGGIRALIEFIKAQHIRPLVVMGVLKRRSLNDLIEPLHGHVAGIIGITIPAEESYKAHDIALCAASFKIPSMTAESFEDALKIAENWSKPFKDIMICGSVYLIGNILRDK